MCYWASYLRRRPEPNLTGELWETGQSVHPEGNCNICRPAPISRWLRAAPALGLGLLTFCTRGMLLFSSQPQPLPGYTDSVTQAYSTMDSGRVPWTGSWKFSQCLWKWQMPRGSGRGTDSSYPSKSLTVILKVLTGSYVNLWTNHWGQRAVLC